MCGRSFIVGVYILLGTESLLGQQSEPNLTQRLVDDLLRRDFPGTTPSAAVRQQYADAVNQAAKKAVMEQVPALSKQIADLFGRRTTPSLQPGPGATTPQQAPVVPQSDGQVARDANLPQGMERVGPVRLTVPDGWTVTSRRSDAVIIKKGAYIIMSRHAGFASAPYTPEGIGRAIIKNSWMRATTSQTTIGKEKLPAFRMRRDAMEAVLFSHAGGVYMVSTDGTGSAFDSVLDSIATGNLVPANQPQAPAPNPVERDRAARSVGELVDGFLRDGAVDAQVAARVNQAIEGARSWIGSDELGKKYNGLCLMFVRDAYRLDPNMLPNATEVRRRFEAHGVLRTTSWENAPPGSWLFFRYEGMNNAGHVAIVTGRNSLVDAMFNRNPVINEVTVRPGSWYSTADRFQGWVSPADVVRWYNVRP